MKNPFGQTNRFDKSRAITDPEEKPKDPEAYTAHKKKLATSFAKLLQDRADRLERKTLKVENISIVEVRFLIPFSNVAPYYALNKFLKDFGLSPVMQRDFNRTVLFAIVDEAKFGNFHILLNQYVESDKRTPPQGTPYAIMTTLFDVKYHTADAIRNNCSGDLVFEFISNNAEVNAKYDLQRAFLIEYLDERRVLEEISSFTIDPYDKMVQIKGASKQVMVEIAQNFDVVAQAHSLRTVTVRPDKFNIKQLTWDLSINNSDDNTMTIGVLDNGIRPIGPLNEIVLDGLDVTESGDSLAASHRHGTVVASLAAVGHRFFGTQNNLTADAKIYSIKIMDGVDGYIDVIKVTEAIRSIHYSHGVRLFNLSVCIQSKAYNEMPSFFAYLLDKLSYELDVLIFIAAGNMYQDDLLAMQEDSHELHVYPNHFYNPGVSSAIHECTFTNICAPAESMNNITVGALADNYRPDTPTHLSLDKNLPAYYTRKNHYDFKQPINGVRLSNNYSNRNLFKPDIVMPGGDLLNDDSAMQVLGFGDNGNDYYVFDAGTSLATPIAANLAAQLMNLYPNIALQSVKALMINSADSYSHAHLDESVEKRRELLAERDYQSAFDDLGGAQKAVITRQILSAEDIHRNIAGYGKPDQEKLLYSTDNAVSLVLEDVISMDHHKVFLINIPEYLLNSTNGKSLHIQATLSFKMNPAWGNHVDYNPLHMSFNFLNSFIKDSPDKLAEVIADRHHDFYQGIWTEEIEQLQNKKDEEALSKEEKKRLAKLKTEAIGNLLGFKTSVNRWSEDFFPLVNKPLSNRQQISIKLAKKDIQKIGNQLVLAVRCAVKENLDSDLQEWIRRTPMHQFSIALRITDESKLEDKPKLYEELQAINTLEIIANTMADLDQDLEADA
ncbi:S8 family peptidase [Sphingobacterium corticis]|uniref:S8 family peptidase n=1 Tax=Sphingobacterium corticis TaxID=1812823 RepID=A0ABW5NM40_9SPHI